MFKKVKQFTFYTWCPRLESNQHQQLRKLPSYPLNDGGNNKCISEPEPRRHQVDEGVMMFFLAHMLQEVGVDGIRVNALKRDDKVR